MFLSIPEAGVALLIAFVVFLWLGILPTVTAIFGFVSVILLSDSGWLGHILANVAAWANRFTETALGHVIGASAAFALTLGLIIVFLHDLHPKHTTGRRTAWIGVALGVLIVSGLTGLPFLDGLRSGIVSAAGGVLSVF